MLVAAAGVLEVKPILKPFLWLAAAAAACLTSFLVLSFEFQAWN